MLYPFPAAVTGPDGTTWALARPISQNGAVYVFTYDRGAVQLAASVPIGTEVVGERRSIVVTTPDGDTWLFAKAPGCGCGHPLKRANPRTLLALIPA
jgi:hypothetical protein